MKYLIIYMSASHEMVFIIMIIIIIIIMIIITIIMITFHPAPRLKL